MSAKPTIKIITIKTSDIFEDYQLDLDNFKTVEDEEENKKNKENLKKDFITILDARFEEFFRIIFLICNQVRHTEIKDIAEAENSFEETRKLWRQKRYLNSYIQDELNPAKFTVELEQDTISHIIKFLEKGIKEPKTFGEGNEKVLTGIWFKKHLDSLYNATLKESTLSLVEKK